METAAPSRGPLPERSVEDVLAGRLRIRLGGEWYVLPVLTIGQNREWVESLDAQMQPLLDGADDGDLNAVVARMQDLSDRLLEFVWSYDRMGVLPPRETLEPDVYPHEALRAVMEVRLAANPTLGFALPGAIEAMRAESRPPSERTSSSRRNTAGPSRTSGTR
jgi:hypothetical protein